MGWLLWLLKVSEQQIDNTGINSNMRSVAARFPLPSFMFLIFLGITNKKALVMSVYTLLSLC